MAFNVLRFIANSPGEWVTPTLIGEAATPGVAYKRSGRGSALLKPLIKAGLVEKHSQKGWYRLTRFGKAKAFDAAADRLVKSIEKNRVILKW